MKIRLNEFSLITVFDNIELIGKERFGKEVLKILQIDCTSPEISEDEAEASTKKRGRKKLYVSEMSFRSEAAICIIKQIDCTIRVNEFEERSSGQVQPNECIHINQEDECYSSLANEIPKFKINKLPPWAVSRGAIHTSSSSS
ncbi:20124_t:CDS:2, partial [Gigaspora margarita]